MVYVSIMFQLERDRETEQWAWGVDQDFSSTRKMQNMNICMYMCNNLKRWGAVFLFQFNICIWDTKWGCGVFRALLNIIWLSQADFKLIAHSIIFETLFATMFKNL